MWLSLVERCVRDAEVAGSNPVTSITETASKRMPFFVVEKTVLGLRLKAFRSRFKASSEHFRGGGPAAVADMFPYLLSKPLGSEYLYGNTINAVADLLHETHQRAAASEYFRAIGPDAVADVFPYLLAKPLGSEYLYGNTVHAVADLLRATAQRAVSSEHFRGGGLAAVAAAQISCEYISPPHSSSAA